MHENSEHMIIIGLQNISKLRLSDDNNLLLRLKETGKTDCTSVKEHKLCSKHGHGEGESHMDEQYNQVNSNFVKKKQVSWTPPFHYAHLVGE